MKYDFQSLLPRAKQVLASRVQEISDATLTLSPIAGGCQTEGRLWHEGAPTEDDKSFNDFFLATLDKLAPKTLDTASKACKKASCLLFLSSSRCWISCRLCLALCYMRSTANSHWLNIKVMLVRKGWQHAYCWARTMLHKLAALYGLLQTIARLWFVWRAIAQNVVNTWLDVARGKNNTFESRSCFKFVEGATIG
jgi:hypothetical protein